MKNIKYLIHYDVDSEEGRSRVLSATNKADYIIECLGKLGYNVEIISASLVSSKGYIKGSKTKIADNITLTKLPAFKWGNKFQKIIAYLWNNIALFLYLLISMKKNEELVVYHSLSLMKIVKYAKKIKNFKLILEVEEIYSDVIGESEKKRQKEISYFEIAEKYIFPTEMLNEVINKDCKPYCIIHGTYKVETQRDVSFEDGKIHVVYAGTFDPRKGGTKTVEAAEYLTKDYHVHILGFGSKEDTKNIKDKIAELIGKTGTKITYEGILSGEEYIKFIQKCHIGMSTQNPDAEFNATSFPSKILSYMANGLRVVSINIPAIYNSDIGKELYYYDEPKPQEIAKAIMSIDINDGYDPRKKIKKLDEKFKEDLKELLEE